MLKRFWNRLRFMCGGKKAWQEKCRHKKLLEHPKVKSFIENVELYSKEQHISWFGNQIIRQMLEYPKAVELKGAGIVIDVKVTAAIPHDWGDEIFNMTYSVEKQMGIVNICRDMDWLPHDYSKNAKEHFEWLHWIVVIPLDEKEWQDVFR